MAARDNAYSRLIAAIKIVLPIIALGILSMLFILSRPSREGEPLRFVETGLEASGQDERLARPDYRSVTETGGALKLTAAELRPVPQTDGQYTGRALHGLIERRDGVAYEVTSKTGRLDELSGQAWLTGDVRVVQNDGHIAVSDEIEIRTDLSRLFSHGPIHAYGPTGTLDADSMEMIGKPDLSSGTVTVFRGNVRLYYDPQDPDPIPEPR